MFIYLSKKIAIPNNTKLHCIAWNREDGYIAVGGEDGLLKVLKLDSGTDQDATRTRGLATSSNLSMNQTLEGHTESIRVITWNEIHKKLTTSDQNGVIIVWMLYKGAWYEEMINNRKKSTVVGMAWSSDGLKICIIYEDGAVIVGSVDGNRIWGKELKGVQLSGVQWSPDGKLLLFSLQNGQVHLYDNQGNFVMRLEIHCLEMPNVIVPVVGLDWYNGKNGYMHASCPCLAICYENGRMQLMYNESDANPVILETCMTAVYCSWNHNGTLIAVAGRQMDSEKESNVVQFYSPFGDHLRTLKVPGHTVSCCVWEGGSLRVALAVDSYVYFANIRPDYKWCYFKKTIVYTSCRPQKPGVCISFWDTANNQLHSRYVPVLLGIAAFGNHCVLVTKSDGEDSVGEYGLLLCNTLGTPVDGKYIDIEPLFVAINSTHVVAASKNNFLIWQYKTPKSYSILTNRIKCRMYHIDDDPSGAVEVIHDLEHSAELPVSTHNSTDPICSIAASDRALIIGRESGVLQHYALPHTALCNRYKLQTRPHKIAINCNSARISVIDVSGVMTVVDISESMSRLASSGECSKLERKDVWAMCWASDNPQSLAIMEKTRMYIFKGLNPEEPISSSGYICSFQDLEIEAVLLDEVMEHPEKPNSEHILKLEVKSLRDTRQLLEKVGINEAAEFIEDNPHPRLWRLLAEAALKEMNLAVAEAAFIRSLDYCGILFIKKLHGINNEAIRKAAIATYFKEFDEAEKHYVDSDRRDLALILRQTLGDWFRVIQIMKNGVSAPDLVLEIAYTSTADYFAHFNNWSAAVEYYEFAKNRGEMIECYYHLEDYAALQNMIDTLPDGDPLLQNIADMFAADAVYTVAIKALIKLQNVKAAVDLCILHNKWDHAIELATEFDLPQINVLFKKYTLHLVEQNQLANAVEINLQAKHYNNAAELTLKFAMDEAKKETRDLIRIKMLFVYAALLEEKANAGETNLDLKDNIWRGAEAYHYLILAQTQLYGNKLRSAMNTAFRLQEYTNYIDEFEIFSLLALVACQYEAYGVCSTAFIKLKTLPVNENDLAECTRLTFDIFNKHIPCDDHLKKRRCSTCNENLFDWSTFCSHCGTTFSTCVASGEPIDREMIHWVCKTCHHIALERHITFRKCCPLCHSLT